MPRHATGCVDGERMSCQTLGAQVVVPPLDAKGEPDTKVVFNLGAATLRIWFPPDTLEVTPAAPVLESC